MTYGVLPRRGNRTVRTGDPVVRTAASCQFHNDHKDTDRGQNHAWTHRRNRARQKRIEHTYPPI
ncbi:hypothetical protein W02_40910 [Nitrospira sp. KM1]|nr:hypothetical protein W02_40910 [Nitrospira sp. KM1]